MKIQQLLESTATKQLLAESKKSDVNKIYRDLMSQLVKMHPDLSTVAKNTVHVAIEDAYEMGCKNPELLESATGRSACIKEDHLQEEKGKYSSFASWKAACKKANDACWIEGDKDIAQALIGPKPFKHGETFSIGEWDGAVGEVFPRPGSKVAESADLAKGLVRGEKYPKGLKNKLDHWLLNMMVTKDKNRFLPSSYALKALRTHGFTEEQISLIRDAATSAANTAVETMQKKHGEEAVPDKYKSKLPSSFGVFDLFLNVSGDIHDEFAALMRKLFDAKIAKIADKLELPK